MAAVKRLQKICVVGCNHALCQGSWQAILDVHNLYARHIQSWDKVGCSIWKDVIIVACRILEEDMVITVEPGCYFNPVLLEPAMAGDDERRKFLVSDKIRQNMVRPSHLLSLMKHVQVEAFRYLEPQSDV